MGLRILPAFGSVLLVVALAASGCGTEPGDRDASAVPTASTGGAPPPVPPPEMAALAPRLTQAGVLPEGFVAVETVEATDLAGYLAFVSSEEAREDDQRALQEAGFAGAAVRSFHGPDRDPDTGLPQALSTVAELRSPEAALAEVERLVERSGDGNSLRVPGSSDAVGVEILAQDGSFEALLLLQADGRFVHRLAIADEPGMLQPGILEEPARAIGGSPPG